MGAGGFGHLWGWGLGVNVPCVPLRGRIQDHIMMIKDQVIEFALPFLRGNIRKSTDL